MSDWLSPLNDKRYADNELMLNRSIATKEPAPLSQIVRGRIGYGEPAFPSFAKALLWVTNEQFLITLEWVPDVVLTCPLRLICNVEVDKAGQNITVARHGFMGPLVPDPSNPNNKSYYFIVYGPNTRLRDSLLEAIRSVAPGGFSEPIAAEGGISERDVTEHTAWTFDQLRNHLDSREHVESMDWPAVVGRLLREHELGLAERAGTTEAQAQADRAILISNAVLERIGSATLVRTFCICHWALETDDLDVVFDQALANSGYNQARRLLFPESH